MYIYIYIYCMNTLNTLNTLNAYLCMYVCMNVCIYIYTYIEHMCIVKCMYRGILYNLRISRLYPMNLASLVLFHIHSFSCFFYVFTFLANGIHIQVSNGSRSACTQHWRETRLVWDHHYWVEWTRTTCASP